MDERDFFKRKGGGASSEDIDDGRGGWQVVQGNGFSLPDYPHSHTPTTPLDSEIMGLVDMLSRSGLDDGARGGGLNGFSSSSSSSSSSMMRSMDEQG
jgi:hypothetical protein